MKKGLGLLTKVLSVVLAAALILGTSGMKAYAADAVSHNKQNSPEYSTTKDMEMVFSVRKQLQPNDDLTENGNIFDGKPIGEYHQIHTNTAETGDNGRYSTPVSGAAVSAVIGDVLNAYTGSDKYTGAHNINETMALSGNGDQSVLAEEVLKAVLGEDDYNAINLLADEYIRARLGLTGNKEAIVSIDWYVIKHQKDGRVGGRYHVDGNVTVTYKEYEDWTVVYNFEQKDADPEKIALEDKITVEKDVTPSFNREEIMNPSEVDSKFKDDLYILRADETELAVVDFDSDNKTIEIYYDLAREEWTVAYNFEQKDADPKRIELEEKIVVFKDERPDFADENIMVPSEVDENLNDNDYTITLNEDGTKFELTDDKTIEIRYELVKEDPTTEDPTTEDPTNEDPTDDDPKQDDTNDIPLIIIPPVINNNPETKEEPKEELPVEEPVTPEGTPEEEESVEEIPVEEPGTPEGAPVEEEPVEEIPVEEPGTPEGAPVEEEEEEIPVDIPATPEGDVLPQTGVASAAAFFGFGAAFIGLGAFAVLNAIRKEEI